MTLIKLYGNLLKIGSKFIIYNYNSYFITTWNTELTGGTGSASKTIVIPIYSSGYNCTIDWGDNSTTTYTGGTLYVPSGITHVYTTTGIKTISISGTFPQIYFNNGGDKLKLITINQWGTGVWRQMNYAFYGCSNMTGTYTDVPNTTLVTSMDYMFNNCALFNSPVNFNTTNVQYISRMFYYCYVFDQSVSNFNTSNVTSMNCTFYMCQNFNQSVSNFNTSKVTNMDGTFYMCQKFNQSVSNFDTTLVTSAESLFDSCYVFNQSVSNFNTSKITNFSFMFSSCYAFNQSVSNFDTSKATHVNGLLSMFYRCYAFNQSVSNFNTSSVTNMVSMFDSCSIFNQSVSNFNTSGVTNMSSMFRNVPLFKQSLATFTISAATNMSSFAAISNINETGTTTNYDNTLISWAAQTVQTGITVSFGTSKYSGLATTARAHLVTTHGWTITDGGLINSNDFITTWDTTKAGSASKTIVIPTYSSGYNCTIDWGDNSTTTYTGGTLYVPSGITHVYASGGTKVISISGTFPQIYFASTGDRLKIMTIANWGTGVWRSMASAFQVCSNLSGTYTNIPNTSQVQLFNNMFDFCSNFNSSCLFDTSNATTMNRMFYFSAFNKSVSTFNTAKVQDMTEMFKNSAFNQPVTSFNTSAVTNMSLMFYWSQFKQSVATFDISNVTSLTNFAQGCTLSTADYDATLISWAAQSVKSSLNTDFWISKYSASASTARDHLINTHGWTITDGGSNDFITTWDTTKAGSASNTIVIPTYGSGYNCTIYWGDDTTTIYTGGTLGVATGITHVYASGGTKIVSITGTFPRIYFNDGGDKLKLMTIANWGTGVWSNMDSAFAGCANMTGTYTDTPNTSLVPSMYFMFYNCVKFNSPVSFSTVNVLNTSQMFFGCSVFNQSVSNFNTAKVTDMSNMFRNCSIFDQSVSNFNTAGVTNMVGLFYSCSVFNQSVSNFNTGNVQTIALMFNACNTFKQSLSTFLITGMTNMSSLLSGCDINASGTTTNYDNTLISWSGQTVQSNITVSFGTSKYSSSATTARDHLVTTHGWTITDGGLINSNDFITTWNTENTGSATKTIVIPTYSNGYNCVVDWGDSSTTTYTGGTLNVAGTITHVYATAGIKTVSISGTFPIIYFNNTGDKLKILTIANWGSQVWSSLELSYMGCTNLTATYTDRPNLSSVSSMYRAFRACSNFNGSFSGCDTSNVTNIGEMFMQCVKYNQSIDSWNTSAITGFNGVFNGCTIYNQSMSSLNLGSVTSFANLFASASAFNQSVSNFISYNCQSYSMMFASATTFKQSCANFRVDYPMNVSIGLSNTFGSIDINASGTTTNYDNTLIGWATQNARNGMQFTGTLSKYTEGIVNTGTTTSGSTGKLIQSGQNFITTVTIGDVVRNTTDGTYAIVTAIDSDTQLSISVNIMTSGKNFTIQHSDAAKARAHLTISHTWTITDGGPQ